MTIADYLTLFASFCAALSAFFWAASSKVNIRTGYDMDQETGQDLARAARLNGYGAAFAAVAAICSAIISAAKVIPWLVWINQ